MATVTNLISGGTASTTNAATYASASHTPPGGEVLFYFVAASGTQLAAPTLTASANGMTFTLVGSARANTSTNRLYVFVSDQATPASPAAMTVTFDCTGDTATGAIVCGCAIDVSKTGTAAVKQSAIAENGATATPDSVTFAAACNSANPILSVQICTVTTGTAPPTGMTEQVDANYSTPATGGGYRSRDSGFTGTTLSGTDTSIGAWGAIGIEVDASAAAITANLTPATETDSTATLGRRKSKSLTPAVETDIARDVTRFIPPQTVTLTPASETDTVVPLARRKTRTLTPASETDTVVQLARRKSKGVTPTGQTDSAVTVARLKSRTLTPATEADEAIPVTRAGGHLLTPAVEADTVVTLTRLKSRTILPATETDTAPTVTRRIVRSLNPATESDTGVGIRPLVTASLTPATETDVVVHLAPQKSRLLGPAAETGSAVTITRRKILALVPVDETDEAFAVEQLLPFIPAARPGVTIVGGKRGAITGIGDREASIASIVGGQRGTVTGIGDRETSVTSGDRSTDVEPREVSP